MPLATALGKNLPAENTQRERVSRFRLKVRCGGGLEHSILEETRSLSFSLRLSAGDWQTLACGRGRLRRSATLILVFVWEGSVGFGVASRGGRTQPETLRR